MAQFGALAPFGLLAFGDGVSAAERIYHSLRDAVKDAFDVTEGTHAEATIYARAIALASVRATIRHGYNQRRPRYAVEMLPALERTYGVVPLPSDTLDARRRAVSAQRLVRRGSRPEALEAALTELLGAGYYGVRDIRDSEAATFPPTPGSVGVFADPAQIWPNFELLTPVVALGEPVTFQYGRFAADDGVRLLVGQQACIQAENSGLVENVTITATGTLRELPSATAVFTKPHDQGAVIATHMPLVGSNRRHLIIFGSQAVARNAVTLARLYTLLHKILGGTTTFHLYEVNGATPGPWIVGVGKVGISILGPILNTQAGPFRVGESRIGITPVGSTVFKLQ